jgi:hypothetical protein
MTDADDDKLFETEKSERTGAGYYCLHCRGACTLEHLAELA